MTEKRQQPIGHRGVRVWFWWEKSWWKPWRRDVYCYDTVELAEEGTYVHMIFEWMWKVGPLVIVRSRVACTTLTPWPDELKDGKFVETGGWPL